MKILRSIFAALLCLAFTASAVTTNQISILPVTNNAGSSDYILENGTNTGQSTFTTYTIRASDLAASTAMTNALVTRAETNSMVRTNDTRGVSLGNTNNVLTAAYYLFAAFGGPTGLGGLVWTNGGLECPQDNNGTVGGLNIALSHGTDFGNGVEWEFIGNQYALAMTDGNHFQFGPAQGTFGNSLSIEGMGGQNSTYAHSSLLNFKLRYGSGTAFALTGMWADTWDWTNGGTMEHFYSAQAPGTWTTIGKDVMGIDSDNGVGINYYLRSGFTNDSAAVSGTNYTVNWTNQQNVRLDLGNNLTLLDPNQNLNLEGHWTNGWTLTKDLWIYSGFVNWNFTGPTNWVNEGSLGPVNISSNNVLHAHVTKNVLPGVSTNTYVLYTAATNPVVVDSDAVNFFNASGITNSTEKFLINQMVVSLKASNLWTRYDAIYPFCSSGLVTSNGMSINLANTNNFKITWNGAAGASGITFSSMGPYGNGGSVYGDTGFNPSSATSPNFVQNSAGTVVYSKFEMGYTNGAGSTGNGQTDFGANGSANLATMFTSAGTSNAATTMSVRGLNNVANITGNTYGHGFQLMNRTGATAFTWAIGSASSGTDATPSVGVNSQNFFVMANNDSGPFRFSTNAIGLAAIRSGFNPSDLAAESNIFLTYLTGQARQ